MKQGTSPDTQALCAAIAASHEGWFVTACDTLKPLTVLKRILAAGADIDAFWQRRTALMRACEQGRVDTVRYLLSAGANVHARDCDFSSTTALMEAVKSGQPACLSALVEAGADINQTTSDGFTQGLTALHRAVTVPVPNALAMVRRLIALGADVNAVNEEGETPLHGCCYGSTNVEAARALLEAGADVDARDQAGETPLFYVKSAEIVALLESYQADFDIKNDRGQSALSAAASFASLETFIALAERSNCLKDSDDYGDTPLHIACIHGHFEIAREMLSRGADIDARNQDGQTPLTMTSSGEFTEALRAHHRTLALEANLDSVQTECASAPTL